MAYTVNKTDGTVLVNLIDGTLDSTTDLTLIGKNYSGFGEAFNENLVKLLENFSNSTAPERPLTGQLWYDITDNRLKVYNSTTGWKVSGGPVVSSTQPLTLTTGDFWIDNEENQLHFYDGTDLVLAGPIWKRSQGKTGFETETLFDANGNAKPVLKLFVNNSLFGIFAAEAFTPVPAISGFGSLIKGYNTNSLVNAVFSTTSSNSLALNNLSSTQFMRSDVNTTTIGKITVQNNSGITIGLNQLADLKVAGNTFILENAVVDGDISFRTTSVSGTTTPIFIDSSTERVGIFTTNPQQTMDINGTLRVRGDMIVEGNNLSVEVATMRVEDKNIELAYTASPTDTLADGGGMIIKGASDKTILYNNSDPRFDISETINLAAGKVIKIGGVEILSGTTLSAAITSAPGITSFGSQINITVGDLYLQDNKISSTISNQDIVLDPSGTGNVALEGSPKITGLANPTNPQDAATKAYVDTAAANQPLSISIVDNELTGAINTNIALFLTDVANPIYFSDGKMAFVHCQHLDYDSTAVTVTRYLKKFEIQSGVWAFVSDLSSSI